MSDVSGWIIMDRFVGIDREIQSGPGLGTFRIQREGPIEYRRIYVNKEHRTHTLYL